MVETPFQRILSRLRRVERRRILTGVAEALSAAVLAFTVIVIIAGAVEAVSWFPPEVRVVLAAAAFIKPTLFLLVYIAIHFIRRPDFDGLARMVERSFPELGDRLISAVQLGRLDDRELRGQSPDLVRALVERVDLELSRLPLNRTISLRRLTFLGRAASGGLVLLLVLAAAPGPVAGALCRLADPRGAYLRPGGVFIHTLLHDASVVRGEDFVTPGFVTGKKDGLVLSWKWKGAETWNTRPVPLNREKGTFTLLMEKPRESFAWYLESGSRRTPRAFVTVIERPVIEKLEVTLRYPRHTGFGTATFADEGNIRALRGTVATLRATVNKPLSRMAIHWGDSTVTECAVTRASGSASFTVQRDIEYRISLLDTLGIGDVNPIVYRISAVEDEPPAIAVLDPTGTVVAPRTLRIPIYYRAEDDFGLSRISLIFRLPDEDGPRAVDIRAGAIPREIEGRYEWDLSPLNPLPGDVFTGRLAAYDNDAVRGPKKALSDTFTVRIPSLVDVMKETADSDESGMERLSGARDRTAEKDRALDDVRRGLVEGKKPGWSERNAVEESKKRLQALDKEVRDLSRSLKDGADKLGGEDMAALETVEKLRTIAKMMDELAEGDLKEALRRLTRAGTELDPKEMKNLLDGYRATAGEVQKRLDNLIALLEKVKSIQRYDASKRILADIMKKQAEIEERFLSTPDARPLAREQEALSAETGKLENELEKMAEDLAGRFSLNTEPFRKKIGGGKTSKGMKDTSGSLAKNDRGKAADGIREAEKGLAGMMEAMDALGASMRGANTREMRARVLAAATELLAVSESEETLVGMMSRSGSDELAKRQLDIMESFTRAERSMSALGAVSAELAGVVDRLSTSIRMTMKGTVDFLAAGSVKEGERNSRMVLGMLNQTAFFLTELLKNQDGAKGAKGMPGDLMEELMMIANGQMSLRMSLQDGAGMEMLQRLAAEQKKLSDMLSELARRSAEDKRLREMLDKLSGDMDETASMMRRNEPRERIERRQLDTYRRLLDARRSRRERDDESDERKSLTAKQNESKGAARLDPSLGVKNAEFEARMKSALEDDFGDAWRGVVRRYFESVLGDVRSLPEGVKK